MYRPNSLDQERASWRTVIYFNVVRSLKHILATLEAWDDTLEDIDTSDDSASISFMKSRSNGIADQPSPSTSLLNKSDAQSTLSRSPPRPGTSGAVHRPLSPSGSLQVANLRRRLSPLIAADEQLADRLSGGITVSGSGKGGVYVRSGWQARTIESALGRIRPAKRASEESEVKKSRESLTQEVAQDPLVQDVGHMLEVSQADIKELWAHPVVRGLIAKRKLKLDEWSELYASSLIFIPYRSLTEHLSFSSFLQHISRVAASDYVPTTGRRFAP